MPLNILDIKELCEEYGIILIEDVAQAFGTKINEVNMQVHLAKLGVIVSMTLKC